MLGSVSRFCVTPASQFSRARLFQLCVFGLGGDEDGNVKVTVFPEREEILIGRLGSCGIALQGIGPANLEMSKCTDGFV